MMIELTFLKVSRQPEIPPKISTTTGCFKSIRIIGNIRFISSGNKYQSDWINLSKSSSNALLVR